VKSGDRADISEALKLLYGITKNLQSNHVERRHGGQSLRRNGNRPDLSRVSKVLQGVGDAFLGVERNRASRFPFQKGGRYSGKLSSNNPIGLSFAKTPQGHKSRPVTMLQARPHAVHFKRILDFGEGQESKASDRNLPKAESLIRANQ
jgi:hypothetical protein